MLIHSCIYYELNDNIVSDHQWQAWADELQKLQEDHPDQVKIDFYDWEFRDWDGATGAHLPHRDPWVFSKAHYIMELHERLKCLPPPNLNESPTSTMTPATNSLENFFS